MKSKSHSQKDMFRESDSDTELKNKALSRTTSSLGSKKDQYLWVILFSWNVNVRNPFGVHKAGVFNENEIKPEWLSKNLGYASRMIKLTNLSPFPGGVFSLFGKIEKGIITNNIYIDMYY